MIRNLSLIAAALVLAFACPPANAQTYRSVQSTTPEVGVLKSTTATDGSTVNNAYLRGVYLMDPATGLPITGGGGGGGPASIADGADVAEGAKADAVCATDTGTCSALALLKRGNTNLSALNTQMAALTPARTATVASGLSVASAGSIQAFSGSSTVAGYWLVFDATTCPADGTVAPYDQFPYPTAGAPFAVDYNNSPLTVTTGKSVCFSTTGPFTKTASATAFISLKAR